jgi:predicted RNase H-like HicB family nuclease
MTSRSRPPGIDSSYLEYMNLVIELDREVDGRWIAEVAELNVLVYGTTREEAIRRAQEACREIIADLVGRGEIASSADLQFAVPA